MFKLIVMVLDPKRSSVISKQVVHFTFWLFKVLVMVILGLLDPERSRAMSGQVILLFVVRNSSFKVLVLVSIPKGAVLYPDG